MPCPQSPDVFPVNAWSRQLPADRAAAACLSAPGSLTAYIRRRWKGFRVQPLGQRNALPLPDEVGLVFGSRTRGAVVREVLLMDGDTPLVFAHSVAAAHALSGPWRNLRGLGKRPLADLLYSNPRIVRRPLQFRTLARQDPLAQRLRRALPAARFPLWARRSIFLRAGQPLLVTEVFLPAILGRER